jgi:hypothetical protein
MQLEYQVEHRRPDMGKRMCGAHDRSRLGLSYRSLTPPRDYSRSHGRSASLESFLRKSTKTELFFSESLELGVVPLGEIRWVLVLGLVDTQVSGLVALVDYFPVWYPR